VSQIVSFITTILLASAFANFVSQESYGTYKYFLTLISLFSIFTLTGMNTAINRSVGHGAESNVYLGLKTKIKWGVIGSIISLITSIYYLLQGNTEFSVILLIISFFIPFNDSFTAYQAYLSGKKLFKIVSINNIQIKIISTVVLLFALFYTDKIWILVAAFIVPSTLLNGIYLYFNLKKYPPKDTSIDTNLSDGIHLSIMGGLGVITGSLQGIALWHFLGPVGLAIYSFAMAPIEQIRPFLRFSEALFLPKIAKDSWTLPSFPNFLKKLLPFVLTITVGVFFYIITIPYVFKILFPTYVESIIYSQVLSVSLIFTAITIVTYTILKAKKEIKALYFLNTVNVVSDIIMVIPATYFFGIYGLIFSIILQKILTVISVFVILFKKH
jgi:O-antigen/teichoic acid export membrane protein